VDCHQSVAELSRRSVKSAPVAIDAFCAAGATGLYLLRLSAGDGYPENWTEERVPDERVTPHIAGWTLSRPGIAAARHYLLASRILSGPGSHCRLQKCEIGKSPQYFGGEAHFLLSIA
jgi:hypothetical protein